jgi:hypothetical protein
MGKRLGYRLYKIDGFPPGQIFEAKIPIGLQVRGVTYINTQHYIHGFGQLPIENADLQQPPTEQPTETRRFVLMDASRGHSIELENSEEVIFVDRVDNPYNGQWDRNCIWELWEVVSPPEWLSQIQTPLSATRPA